MTTAVLALLALMLGIAAGHWPHLTIRGAAMDWSPHRAPDSYHLMTEGTTIMSADSNPDYLPDSDTGLSDPAAEVVDLEAARAARSAPAGGLVDEPDSDGPEDGDAESVLVGEVVATPAVDPPDEPRSFLPRSSTDRRPVIPPALASRSAMAQSVRWALAEVGYHAGFHAVRLPKYAAKIMLYAVPGALKTVVRVIRWANADEGNWHLRKAAADRNDAAAWLALDARRQRQTRFRWPVVIGGTTVLSAGGLVLAFEPGMIVWQVAAFSAAVAAAARAGRPADRPITDRVSQGRHTGS